jgi:hypothetical protein
MSEDKRRVPSTLQHEVYNLAAETMALQNIMVGVFEGLLRMRPELRAAIEYGFESAVNITEDIAIQHGTAANPEQTVRAIEIVEALRSGVFGIQQRPTGGI